MFSFTYDRTAVTLLTRPKLGATSSFNLSLYWLGHMIVKASGLRDRRLKWLLAVYASSSARAKEVVILMNNMSESKARQRSNGGRQQDTTDTHDSEFVDDNRVVKRNE